MDGARDSEWRATHDPLTKLPNRGWLEQLHIDGPDTPLGVVYFDVENFRSFAWSGDREDPWAKGDRALKDIAARLQRTALPGTVVVRLGSSHFVAVVTSAPVPEVTAEQLEAFRQEFTTPSNRAAYLPR